MCFINESSELQQFRRNPAVLKNSKEIFLWMNPSFTFIIVHLPFPLTSVPRGWRSHSRALSSSFFGSQTSRGCPRSPQPFAPLSHPDLQLASLGSAQGIGGVPNSVRGGHHADRNAACDPLEVGFPTCLFFRAEK